MPQTPPSSDRLAARRFTIGLVALVLLGLGARLAYALVVAPDESVPGDTFFYHQAALNLADGKGYTIAGLLPGPAQPTSAHPPLFPLYLAAFAKLGLTSLASQRVLTCLLGAVAVALAGLLGRRVAGPTAGLVAAGVAALYPPLVMLDGTVLADSLYLPLVAGTVLLGYRLLDRPTAGRAAALGAAIGLAALTRPEAILLLLLLVAPLAWVLRSRSRPLVLVGAAAVATALVLAPWLGRNLVVQDRFPLLSTNGSLTAASVYCDEAFYGADTGFVAHQCALRSACLRIRDEVPQSECFSREARAYLRHHLGRLPVVVAARVARAWQLFRVEKDLDYQGVWGRQRDLATAGLVVYGALLALAAGGLLLLRRRRVPVLPLVAPLLLVVVAAALTFGFSRYRLAAEVPLVVLAAVPLSALLEPRRGGVRAPGATPRRPAPEAVASGSASP